MKILCQKDDAAFCLAYAIDKILQGSSFYDI